MDLLLEIISHQRFSLPAERTRFVFKAAGGSIGRNSDCDWCIDDPERLISGIHSLVIFEDNRFYILDKSTNGLFVNAQAHPLGEQKYPVCNGDRFSMGDFELRASLMTNQNNAVFSSSRETEPGTFNNPSRTDNVAIFPEQIRQDLDPLAAFNNTSPASPMEADIIKDTDSVHSVLQPVAFSQSYINLPEAIPENWHAPENPATDIQKAPEVGDFSDFNNDFNNPVSMDASQRARTIDAHLAETKSPVADVPPSSINKAEPQTRTSPVNNSYPQQSDNVLKILLDTLGIDVNEIQEEKIPLLVKNTALISKHSMLGIMQVMNDRAHLKNEFRMERTTIKTEQNNPLKFCINYEQLVHYLLTHPVPGYLDSERSVKEAFQEIQEHQIAVMSGMKSALMYMLNKLSPEKIQKRSDKTISLTLSNKKTRYWEAYKALFEDIMSEDDVFNHVFGNEFCRAYEQQVEMLQSSRKDNK